MVAPKDNFEKTKARQKIWLAVLGAFVIVLIIVTSIFLIAQHTDKHTPPRQEQQNTITDERQHYLAAADFLSSESPAIRQKGVRALYMRAQQIVRQAKGNINDDDFKKIEEIWHILNDHVKYFTRNKSYQESFPYARTGTSGHSDDIESIVRIQTVSDYGHYPFKDIRVIDWEGTWLRGVNLNGAELHGANLKGADLQKANLSDAQLQGADLSGARLQGADLADARLQGTYLPNAQLQGAFLPSAQLQGADLEDAQLQAAFLENVQLQEAKLQSAQLQGAFSSADAAITIQKLQLEERQKIPWYLAIYHGRTALEKIYQDRTASEIKVDFETVIRSRAALETEINSVVFEGGMTTARLSAIEEKMNLDAAIWEANDDMRERKKELELLLSRLKKEHRGDALKGADIPAINGYLKNRQAVPGTYAEHEANEWIAEYKEGVGLEE